MMLFSQFRNMLFILILGISLGTILMIGVYCLPTNRMLDNIKNSTEYFKAGEFPQWSKNMDHTTLDNFTDSIMILKAVYPVENVLESAMLIPSWSPVWNGEYAAARGLVELIEADRIDISSEKHIYPRYWHGYLSILKPMLLILNLERLRVLNLYIQFLLATTALLLLYKKLGIYYAYSFALIILIINPITTALSFQFTNVYCTMLLTVILILLFNNKLIQSNRYAYFFMIIGMITAYFDFLTYPMVPLGIGLTICFALNKKIFLQKKIKIVMMDQLNKLFSWAFGYAGMWSGKVIAATLLTNYDIFHDMLREVTIRMSHYDGHNMEGPAITVIGAATRSFNALKEGPIKFILIAFFIYFLYLIFLKKKKFIFEKITLIVFLFIGLLPFLWYAIACNHSMMHNYLAYRELTITLFAIFALFIESIPNLKRKEEYQ